MDKEFLRDYEAREIDEMKKFAQKFREGKIRQEDRYPQTHRLKLNEPYTKAIDGGEIWTQVPLYGTTIIVLKPTRKEIFKKIHGFDVEDVDRLIDFTKQTGRIQFALDEHPTRYEHLNFLEPLFKDLMPPELIHIPLDCITTDQELQHLYHEISSLLENPQSLNFVQRYAKQKYQVTPDDIKHGLIQDLIRLRLLGHTDLVEDFIAWLGTVDVMRYTILLQMIHDVFLFPYDPLKGVRAIKRPHISELSRRFLTVSRMSEGVELPYEVGKFLNDKLNLMSAKDAEGAIKLSDEYDVYDLRKVMRALNECVEREKVDAINEKSREIAMIFENIWRDADRLRGRISIARHTVSFGIGIVGAIATLPVAGVGGLLSGLGFEVADKILDIKAYESISEKLMKLTAQNSVVHVYDFKKKYRKLH